MLHTDQHNNIRITRGDYGPLKVKLWSNVTRAAYTMASGDKLALTVKKTMEDGSTALIQKQVTGTSSIDIEAEDTEDLDYGVYRYDVRFWYADDDDDAEPMTVIEDSEFRVTEGSGAEWQT